MKCIYKTNMLFTPHKTELDEFFLFHVSSRYAKLS